MFKLKMLTRKKAQSDLAAAIMSPGFQEVFNLNKGSIPVRLNMKMDKFDDCAKASCQGLRGHRQVSGFPSWWWRQPLCWDSHLSMG
jgi:ABC-type glycerol-3-phosphate transport system substrate-binding protein